MNIPITTNSEPAISLSGGSAPGSQACGTWQQTRQETDGGYQQGGNPAPDPREYRTTPGTPAAGAFQQPSGVGQGVSLKKGQKLSLSKMSPDLRSVNVGLGWELGSGGQSYDLDVEAFMLGQDGRVVGDNWFVFYNQPVSPDGAVRSNGDSRDGRGGGDDEVISVNLDRLAQSVQRIVFVVTINEAKTYGYNFSNVRDAYVRIADADSGRELARFNLTEYYPSVCSMVVGELYRHNGEWKFNPVGDGTADDLLGLCRRYGVNITE